MVKVQATTALEWEVKSQDDITHIHLLGELTRETLFALYQQQTTIMATLKDYAKICWDLQQLVRIDSAGFALLCELLHQCQNLTRQSEKKINITVINYPSQLLTLGDLFNLSSWLQQFLIQSNHNME